MEEWLIALMDGKVIKKETTYNLSNLTVLLHKKQYNLFNMSKKDWKYHRHTKKK
ncbi:hypothetical protein ACT7DE_22600 [Bacillus paranthracis]